MERIPKTSLTADERSLLAEAESAAARAYAPYSRFHVGACLETADGRRFHGANVENASYPLAICAERVAAAAAAAAGARSFRLLALHTPAGDPARPCGACRQFLAEFGSELRILVGCSGPEVERWSLAELLPGAFTKDALPPRQADRDQA